VLVVRSIFRTQDEDEEASLIIRNVGIVAAVALLQEIYEDLVVLALTKWWKQLLPTWFLPDWSAIRYYTDLAEERDDEGNIIRSSPPCHPEQMVKNPSLLYQVMPTWPAAFLVCVLVSFSIRPYIEVVGQSWVLGHVNRVANASDQTAWWWPENAYNATDY